MPLMEKVKYEDAATKRGKRVSRIVEREETSWRRLEIFRILWVVIWCWVLSFVVRKKKS